MNWESSYLLVVWNLTLLPWEAAFLLTHISRAGGGMLAKGMSVDGFTEAHLNGTNPEHGGAIITSFWTEGNGDSLIPYLPTLSRRKMRQQEHCGGPGGEAKTQRRRCKCQAHRDLL